jgi:endonuclease/exonuclease/phosphatase family metal-dependent hydrolase
LRLVQKPGVGQNDIPDPQGFQHPSQAVYVFRGGFDAVVVTVHLTWSDEEKREKEKELLCNVVSEMLKIDPDVIIVGDFNTGEKDMQELARTVGMILMVPSAQDGIGTTHAGNRYDYFLISPDLANEEAVSCHIEVFSGNDLDTAKKVSDHLPVVAWFKTDIQFKDRK